MYEDLIKKLRENAKWCVGDVVDNCLEAADVIEKLQSQVPEWIPFELRELDSDEKENYPDWDFILTGKLPEDGQRILVNCVYKGSESVQMDEFYSDCDGIYLDSGYEIGTEVDAWMPLPEPLRGIKNG